MMCGSSMILFTFNRFHASFHIPKGQTKGRLWEPWKSKSRLDWAFFWQCAGAVAWKRPVVSHDVWVVRDTIYVQQTSCWLPWHMEKRLTVASSSALFWMFLSIIHGLNVPRLILLNFFFFMIVFSLFSYEPILVFRSISVSSLQTHSL